MLELYWAYQDWQGLMDFTENLLKKLIGAGKTKWPRIAFADSFKKYAKIDVNKLKNDEIDDVFKKKSVQKSSIRLLSPIIRKVFRRWRKVAPIIQI